MRTFLTSAVALILLSTTVASPTHAAAPQSHRDVVSHVANGDGTFSVSIYTPAPGFTAEQVYAGLQAQGVRGLSIVGHADAHDGPATQAIPPETEGCMWGTASLLWCGVHWQTNPHTAPWVCYRDHTGANVPLIAAVSMWNSMTSLLALQRNNCPPPSFGRYAIDVREGPQDGSVTWLGLTSFNYDSAGYFVPGSVRIDINSTRNNSCAGITAAQCLNRRKWTINHEVGHSVGLGHNVSQNSVMYKSQVNSIYPTPDDQAVLAVLYQ